MSPEFGLWLGQLDDLAFEPYEAGRVHWLRRDERPDGRQLWAGIWEVGPEDLAPGALHESMHDETFLILEGSLRLEIEEGPTLDLAAGAMASLAQGTRARWTIVEPTREFFVYT
jgi:uncharacterized cupin superfamily protein